MKIEKPDSRLPLPDVSGKRFAIVTARFYRELSNQLVDGAMRAFKDCGVAENDVETYDVPGCFELPIAARNLIRAKRFDGVVALGVVVRGETPHFNFVAGECARGIMDVQLGSGVPIGFGVLTTETLRQAEERADPARGDKGYEAALAAATIVALDVEAERRIRAGFRS